MRKILAAIAAAVASMGRFVVRNTWNTAKRTWELTTEIVPAVASGALHIAADVGDVALATADAVIRAPGRILGMLGGGGGATADMPDEQQAAASAAKKAVEHERQADDAADARASIGAVRRLAAARARGQEPSLELRAAVPVGFDALIMTLSPEEAKLVATAKTADLRRWLDDADTAPKGVRGKEKLLADEAALSAAQARFTAGPIDNARATRRAAVRAALRQGRILQMDEEPVVVAMRRAA